MIIVQISKIKTLKNAYSIFLQNLNLCLFVIYPNRSLEMHRAFTAFILIWQLRRMDLPPRASFSFLPKNIYRIIQDQVSSDPNKIEQTAIAFKYHTSQTFILSRQWFEFFSRQWFEFFSNSIVNYQKVVQCKS